jgi:hypothetical protein
VLAFQFVLLEFGDAVLSPVVFVDGLQNRTYLGSATLPLPGCGAGQAAVGRA